MKVVTELDLYDVAQEVLGIIEKDGDIERLTDAEITGQFETIQSELELILKQYITEYLDKILEDLKGEAK